MDRLMGAALGVVLVETETLEGEGRTEKKGRQRCARRQW